MTKTLNQKKKNSKSKPAVKNFVVQVRMTEKMKDMLNDIKDGDLEKDPDAIRRLIKAEYERKNSENVTE